MKFYSSIGPNPRVVRMCAAEKGITFEIEQLDILAGQNRQESYLSINPLGTTPALVLPSGQVITEILPICEYLEEEFPQPALIGTSPEQRAVTRMWARRIDLNIIEPLVRGFRADEGRPLFQGRITLVRHEAASDLKGIAIEGLQWLEGSWNRRNFVAGGEMSMADILLFCFLDAVRPLEIIPFAELPQLSAWFNKMAERASSKV